MPPITFPNQRMVRVHRERATSDFLGIKNDNWQAASRDLGAHALQLYLYLASNANNYTVALSPVAVRQAIGMARSTYHDQFHKLVDRGYLVPSTGNSFEFYEVPQTATQTRNGLSANGLDSCECPSSDSQEGSGGHDVLPEDTEINNKSMTDSGLINISNPSQEDASIYIPKVKEITIKRPVAEGKSRPQPVEQPQRTEFVF